VLRTIHCIKGFEKMGIKKNGSITLDINNEVISFEMQENNSNSLGHISIKKISL